MIIFDLFRNNEYKKIIKLLNSNNKIDPNLKDKNGIYLLQYAVISNQKNILDDLLKKKPQLNIFDQNGYSILYYPILFGYNTIISTLINYDSSIIHIIDKKNNSALHYAVHQNDVNIIKLLIAHNIDIFNINNEGMNAFHIAILNNYYEIVEIIFNYDNNIIDTHTKDGETGLHIACNNNYLSIVKFLISNNALIDQQENNMELTPLMYSIALRYNNLSKYLLEHGSNINIQNFYGDSIIHNIFMTDNRDMVDYIFKHFHTIIDYDMYNDHLELPIHKCLKMPQINISFLNILIKNSDLNFSDIDGNTPLYLLIKTGLWKNYKDILIRKKLNLYTNKLYIDIFKIIDLYDENTKHEFENMIVNSYLNRLQQHPNKWNDEKDNFCSVNPHKDCFRIVYDKIFKNKIGKPVIKKKQLICENDIITCNKCTYTGFHIDILTGLIYLLQKYKQTCSIINSKNNTARENIDRENYFNFISRKGPKIEMEIIWFGKKIFFPINLDHLSNNIKCRYVIIPIGIILEQGNHANYLLYDKHMNEAERFEPYGSRYLKQFDYNPELLDYNIKNKLNDMFPNIKYFTPSDYLPNIGFQYIDTSNNIEQSGYCGLWNIFYIDNRLNYPNINRTKLVKMLIKKIANSGVSFREYIESYSIRISEIRDKILLEQNISISGYCQQNFTDIDEDIIITKLLELYNNHSIN